ncbi:MOXD1 homolog 2-like [Toxorhynchites rutilus septentrionalis]|uniref:MOXD1 homolog 2-like n=1 Tax=Toxorhynchites rutilus septentrionalis TaxID=329112 RepID=UPI00247885A3|nr:MOXD1 homolog 2-like [Toxorhynchites rutilus septentrionalis]
MKKATMSNSSKVLSVVLLVTVAATATVAGAHWDHAVDLDENYRLLWSISNNQDITFEVQARTLGYVGLGFSTDGSIYGADIVIGWVDNGQVHFQDRHFKMNSNGEPHVDPSQDYVLLLGYENATHTVLRFRRKLDTCDTNQDVPITNDTIRIIYMYHNRDPRNGAQAIGTLPDPNEAFKDSVPIFLTQRVNQVPIELDSRTRTLELRNKDVEIPMGDDNLRWCKMFKLDQFVRKQHMIRYEPVIESRSNLPFMKHIILYECQGSTPELEIMSREFGRSCMQAEKELLTCNSIVAAWSRGSEGFTFPLEAGYPLDSYQARFYMMETHYMGFQSNSIDLRPRMDNSGLRLYYTTILRKHDAGVLSVGIQPNWRHIIPPGQERVVSEGHCIEECTQRAFPRPGINIFAVMMQTSHMGKQVRLRQIRYREELPPIAHDLNVDSNYQEFRRLHSPVKALPGDRLIAECSYDSNARKTIALGGYTSRDETCLVLSLYYPRQKELTSCHSIPSLPTVLHAVGINELAPGANPIRIASPPEIAGMTLEERLLSYDWRVNFNAFQYVIRKGAFKPICWSARNTPIPGTENMDAYAPNLTRIWRPTPTCGATAPAGAGPTNSVNRFVTERESQAAAGGVGNAPSWTLLEDESNNVIEGAARSKSIRSSSGVALFGSSGNVVSRVALFVIFINTVRLVGVV